MCFQARMSDESQLAPYPDSMVIIIVIITIVITTTTIIIVEIK